MKDMQLKNQKERNVIKKKILVSFFMICSFAFSQKTIQGLFSKVYKNDIFYETEIYLFDDKGLFKYLDRGDVGINSYGEGHYFIKNDSLILNYDLTEIKYSGYHIVKSYNNLKDSIEIKVGVYDLNKKVISDASVVLGVNNREKTDAEGVVFFRKKNEKDKNTYLEVVLDETIHRINDISLSLCYEIEVYLTKKPYVDIFDKYTAIKNTIQRYKILNISNDVIKLRAKKGNIMILKKID